MQISLSPENKIQIVFDNDSEFFDVRSACKICYHIEEERNGGADEKMIKRYEKILDVMNRV